MHWRWVEGQKQETEVELRGRCRSQQKMNSSAALGTEKRVDLEEVICHWVAGMCFAKNYIVVSNIWIEQYSRNSSDFVLFLFLF